MRYCSLYYMKSMNALFYIKMYKTDKNVRLHFFFFFICTKITSTIIGNKVLRFKVPTKIKQEEWQEQVSTKYNVIGSNRINANYCHLKQTSHCPVWLSYSWCGGPSLDAAVPATRWQPLEQSVPGVQRVYKFLYCHDTSSMGGNALHVTRALRKVQNTRLG